MVHALTLLVIMLAFGRWASLVPMCSLAAILVVVAYHMSEWHAFKALLKAPRSDVVVLLLTFLLTIFFDLTVAVEVGVVLAALTFVKRMGDITKISPLSKDAVMAAHASEANLSQTAQIVAKRVTEQGVEIFEIEGPLCFASADKLRGIMPGLKTAPRAIILRLKEVPTIDATGLHAIDQLHRECKQRYVTLILADVQPRVFKALRRSYESKAIGRKNIFTDTAGALKRAEEILNGTPSTSIPVSLVA